MQPIAHPEEIVDAAREAGLTIVEMCERAKISPSVFYRWRSGQSAIRTDAYERLRRVVCEEVSK